MKHTLTLIMLFVVVGSWGQNADTIKKGWIQINDKTWIHSEPEITITPEKNPNPVAYLTSYGRTIIAINRKYIIVFNDSGNIIGKIAYKGQLEMGSRYDSFKTFTPINLDSL